MCVCTNMRDSDTSGVGSRRTTHGRNEVLGPCTLPRGSKDSPVTQVRNGLKEDMQPDARRVVFSPPSRIKAHSVSLYNRRCSLLNCYRFSTSRKKQQGNIREIWYPEYINCYPCRARLYNCSYHIAVSFHCIHLAAHNTRHSSFADVFSLSKALRYRRLSAGLDPSYRRICSPALTFLTLG